MRPALVCWFVVLSIGCKSGKDDATPEPTGAGAPSEVAAADEAAAEEGAGEAADSEAAAQPSKAAPAAGQGEASLTLSGAIEKELTGTIVTCGHTFLDGRNQGGSWAIRTDELDLSVIAMADEDFDKPTVILNARAPQRMSLVHKPGRGTVTAARDRTVATLDTDLKNVVGAESVHVKGTMTCPPR